MTLSARPRVGYQGEPGAFSEQALLALLPDAEAIGHTTFDDVVEALVTEQLDAALLPVENSIYGPIARSYDLLWLHPQLHIIDETSLAIAQCLIGVPGASLEAIREVHSHSVALEQCRRFFMTHPAWHRKTVDDTAGAVREMILRNDPSIAAVASRFAADLYHAEVLAPDIHDDPGNTTRFFLVARAAESRRDLGRACVVLSFRSRIGALRDALSVLADAGLNLRSLVSRPSGEAPFHYRFSCEIEYGERSAITEALNNIEGTHRILGVY